MNGITVPKEYKHMVRAERRPEYNQAAIRDLIQASPGKVLKGEDFDLATGTTTGSQIVRKLVQKGRVRRFSVKNGERGHSYRYEWVEGNIVAPAPANTVVTKPRGTFTTEYCVKELDKWFMAWLNEAEAEDIAPANTFRKWVHKKQEDSENEGN